MSAEDVRVRYWLSEIEARKKAEKEYRERGRTILEMYSGKKPEVVPFNILFSNTETMFPALYSNVPRAVVERRFKDDDPVGKISADAGRRMLDFLLDTNVDGYETYDQGMRGAVLDALLPGRGVTAVKYDADIGVLDPGETDPTQNPEKTEEEETPADELAEEPAEYKKSELVCLDAKIWNKVIIGPGKKWSKVPWVAFEEDIDQEEAERLFGREMANNLTYTKPETDDGDSPKKDDESEGSRKVAVVYQIWHKAKREVVFLGESYKEGFLKVVPDPLGLTGFYNIPKPLQFIEKSNDLTPTALFDLYENQAKELNVLTVRINNLAKAIKARGIYDSTLGVDIKNLMDAMDNELVPADNSSSLAAEKGLQNAIWFMPLDTMILTLRELMGAREACKQIIYEIMGIADIMRGASNASETLGAQQIKQNWGNLRLKRVQKEVQRYARDLLRMMLEVAATKFSPETWKAMTGLPIPLAEEKASAQAQLQGLQQQAQMAAQQAQMTGQPPQPPPPIDPQLQQMAQSPSWDEVLAILRDDTQRAYRIDIETNSTVEPEAAEDQKNIQELMATMGQFLNGVGPLVAQGVMPFQAAQAMLLACTRRYRFGTEVEEMIKAMQPPKQADPQEQEKAKADAEAQKHQADLADKDKERQANLQMKQVESQQKAQEDQQKAMLEAKKVEADAMVKAQEAVAKAQADAQVRLEQIAADERRFNRELQMKERLEKYKCDKSVEGEEKKSRIQVEGQRSIAKINSIGKNAEEATLEMENQGEEPPSALARILEGQQAILATQQQLIKVISADVVHERGPDNRIFKSRRNLQ